MKSKSNSLNMLDMLTNSQFFKPQKLEQRGSNVQQNEIQDEKYSQSKSIEKLQEQLNECQCRKTQIEQIKKKMSNVKLDDTQQILANAYIKILIKDEEEIEQQLEQQRVEKRQQIIVHQKNSKQREVEQANKQKENFINNSPQRPVQSSLQRVRYVGVQDRQLTEEQYQNKYGLKISQKTINNLRVQKYQQMFMLMMQQHQKVLNLSNVQRQGQIKTNLYNILQNNQFQTLRINSLFKKELDKFINLADGLLRFCDDTSNLTEKIDKMMQTISISYT